MFLSRFPNLVISSAIKEVLKFVYPLGKRTQLKIDQMKANKINDSKFLSSVYSEKYNKHKTIYTVQRKKIIKKFLQVQNRARLLNPVMMVNVGLKW